MALRELATDIWVADAPHRYFVEMGRRMTVVRLRGGGLWLHLPLSERGARRARHSGGRGSGP